ncbi:MAG: hypothetical protein J2P15_07455 [Micromonosporaceae bacterium]|nr:hypothetical protein [Micromonosporaceae bacterium]
MYPYHGSGPYCFANSLAMVLGSDAPPPSVIEVLTGSPFGLVLLGGQLPLFNPYGWDPDIGLDDAIALLGWACHRQGAEDDEQALAMLHEAVKAGPVLAGPVEMGLLRQQPGMTEPVGADHFVAVLEVDATLVRFHDPNGHPYTTLPIKEFLAAWRAETITYRTTSYTMRSDFRRIREVGQDEALRAALPGAIAWLRGRGDVTTWPGTVAGAGAADRLASMVSGGLDAGTRAHLAQFAIRVGARRLTDAATALAGIGRGRAAGVATRQARLVGGLQYDILNAATARAAEALRRLAPTYHEFADALDVDQ